ncbi:MAG: hypothetical protein ACKOPE_04900 [Novosphingobium sp.]
MAGEIKSTLNGITSQSNELFKVIDQRNDTTMVGGRNLLQNESFENRKRNDIRQLEQLIRIRLRNLSDKERELLDEATARRLALEQAREFLLGHMSAIEGAIVEEYIKKNESLLSSLEQSVGRIVKSLEDKLDSIGKQLDNLTSLSRVIKFRILRLRFNTVARNIIVSQIVPASVFIIALCHAVGKYQFVIFNYDIISFLE